MDLDFFANLERDFKSHRVTPMCHQNLFAGMASAMEPSSLVKSTGEANKRIRTLARHLPSGADTTVIAGRDRPADKITAMMVATNNDHKGHAFGAS